MQVVYPICGGIDVHAKMLVACLRDKGQRETRTFSTMTDDLLRLRDWLVKSNCTHVAIEKEHLLERAVSPFGQKDQYEEGCHCSCS
jgi:hypothetical protein